MIEMEVTRFLDRLASKSPTPGGGGASALAGALGIALGNMTGSLTVGKPKYASVEDEILKVNKRSEELRNELYALIERDAQAFMPVSKAYGISKDDPMRDEVMEEALKGAAEVPLEIMRKCCEALEMINVYAHKGSLIAVSDAGCAAAICKSALESAALNVYVNTKSMKDREYAEKMNVEVKELLDKYCSLASEIYTFVLGGLH
jgi:formiminotetrahydrofolate cyclodeaminase